MQNNIAVLLPYKDQFIKDNAGSASIWVKDFSKDKVDIIIGTHKIFSKQSYLKNIGVLLQGTQKVMIKMLKAIIKLYHIKGKSVDYSQILKMEFVAVSVMLGLTIFLSIIVK